MARWSASCLTSHIAGRAELQLASDSRRLEGLESLTRRLFSVPNNALFARFEGGSAKFGAYMSREFGGFRLRLDIKPLRVALAPDGVEEDRLQFNFNFHADVSPGPDAVAVIAAKLARWNEVRQETIETVKTAGYAPQS